MGISSTLARADPVRFGEHTLRISAIALFSVSTGVGLFLSRTHGIQLFLLIAGNLLYNVYFHPLRKYPGPKLWAATRLFGFWHQSGGTLIHKVREFHDKYGPVVRIAPSELSYITDQAWRDIYGFRDTEMQKVVDGRGGILPAPNGNHTILTAPRLVHQRLRRSIAHAFSEKALRDQESYVQLYVDKLLTGIRIESKEGKPSNMLNWFNFTTFDVIGDLAFGEPFGCLNDNQYHSWITSIFRGIQSNPWLQFGIYYQISGLVERFLIPKNLLAARLNNYRVAAEKMSNRLAVTQDRRDFTSYMLRHSDEKGLTEAEMRTMATTLIIAGSETSATLLTGLVFYMLRNRHVYERLVGEIRGRFQNDEDITFISTNNLKYMNAVLEEGLRIYPPVPVVLPRVVPAGGEVICGKFVPENTAVGVPQWATFRSATNFHRPDDFLPERWLPVGDGGSEQFQNDNKAAFQPFSFGPRACLGRNLAYSEMRVILARLLFTFDLELAQDTRGDWNHQRAPLLWIKRPLMVNLTVKT